jgi:transposase InsO family protein
VIFSFIQGHKDHWPVTLMCNTLGVTTQGFYAWSHRPTSQQQLRRDALLVEIRDVHAECKQCYGSPRIYQELVKDRGVKCCVNTIAKLMRENGIRAKSARKFRHTTDSNHALPVAKNLLNRQFNPLQPNESWVADITYIPTREGWLYLAVVEDLFSRMVVGWSMDARMTSRLVVDALEMAVRRRFPESELLAHSDRGGQYASEHYQRLLATHGITCSMSRRANCWDNSPMESFFATLKKELVHHEDYQTRAEARASIFEYIETFYNPKRRHSTLGYLSPAEYEQAGRQGGKTGTCAMSAATDGKTSKHRSPALLGSHLHDCNNETRGHDARQRSSAPAAPHALSRAEHGRGETAQAGCRLGRSRTKNS